MDELIEELSLGSARGGSRRAKQQVAVTSVRPLTQDDVLQLMEPPVVESLPSIPQIKHQHHQIAALIAKGSRNQEISAITGFSPSYISMLKSSPDMKELVAYYAEQAEQRTVDALARLRAIGIASAEELQHRLNESPEKFSTNQLMDLIEVGLIKPMAAAAVSGSFHGASSQRLEINLNFKAPEKSLADDSGPLIEGTVK
jgi:hypothetical protein